MVNDQGELLGFRVTTAEVDDHEPVGRMARELWGHLYGDRGYISIARPVRLRAGRVGWIETRGPQGIHGCT